MFDQLEAKIHDSHNHLRLKLADHGIAVPAATAPIPGQPLNERIKNFLGLLETISDLIRVHGHVFGS